MTRPTPQESIDQKNYILDLLFDVKESARIWRALVRDQAARIALQHIEHAAAVLMDRCQLLSIPPRSPTTDHGPFLSELLP